MNVNDGSEPCPTCHGGVPHGTIKLHAEINLHKRVIDDALIVLECIVADEVADGRRNSGAAQHARSAVRNIRAAYVPVQQPSGLTKETK